jgi:uncharacterized OB-fold protein
VCGLRSHPPDVTCPRCHAPSPDFTFDEVDGGGAVQSWVVIRQSFLPGFEVPYLLVDVALDEDEEIRLIGRLVDGPDAPLARGQRVRVTFDDLGDDFSVPAFALEST